MLPTAMNRRAFLQGIGVSLALPLLDAMRPARAAAEAAAPPRRFVAIQTTQGIMPHLFFPEKAGRDYELSPYLKHLEPLRNDFTVFSGVSHPGVDGGHQNERCFLSAAPHPTGAGFRNSVSVDQVIAEKIGHQTRYPFLALHVANGGETSMSYTRSGVAIPAEKSAAALYAKLFVQGTPAEIDARVNDLKAGRSLLDSVRDRAHRLEDTVGAADRSRLDQYFTSIRELENQLKQAEAWEHRPKPVVKLAPPTDIKDSTQLLNRFRMMLDLAKLSLETDSTRVVTLFLETLGVLSGVEGVRNETHSLTHHGNRPEMVEELSKIESAQLRVFHDFIKGLKETKEPDSTLLDQTSVIYGTCMGNANGHSNTNWPMLLAGGGFKHGQHLAFSREKNMPLANVFVSVLQRMGLETDRFASSTGTLRGLELR